jgi:hypothetical protein
MSKLTLIARLIEQEINRLEKANLINQAEEQRKFKAYEKLAREILENHD